MGYRQDVERLSLMRRTLINARDNVEARPGLESVGYTLEEVTAGQALHDAVQPLIEAQGMATKTYDDACAALATAEETANRNYALDRAVAQREFQNTPKMLEYLGVSGKLDETVQGRFEHARKLYTMPIAEDEAKKLAKGLLTAEVREERMQQVIETHAKRAKVLEALSAREKATDTRDAAIDQALAWLSSFRKIARKLFRDKPHLLELFEL